MKKIIFPVIVVLIIILTFIYVFLSKRGMEGLITNPDNLQGAIPLIKDTLKPTTKDETGKNLKLTDDYSISTFSSGMTAPRDLEIDPGGNLLVADTAKGQILKLPEKIVVIDSLNKPHGIAFANGKLYIAETNQVSYFDYDQNSFKASNQRKILDLPSGGNHFTRSILIKDDKLYVSIGSSCNVCIESDKRRAAIWWSNLDGSDFKPFAKGLRNSVFMTLHPVTKDLWATDMGRDLIGDDIPPEEVNIIRENEFYGWPYCYGNQVIDNQMNANNSKYDCNKSVAPHLSFQAHSAPLGLAFLGTDLLVSYHGSWNRTTPTGYKIVKFPLDKNGNPKDEPIDFLTGWLVKTCADNNKSISNTGGCSDEVVGRPADILVKSDKKIYISDDKSGVVYLISK